MAGSNFECWKKRNCLNLQSVKVMPLLWTVEWYTVYIYHILTSSVIITCSHSSLRYFKWSSLHHSLHTSGDAIHGVPCYLRHFRDIKIEITQGNEYQKFLETTSKVFPWGRNRGIRLIFFPNLRYLLFVERHKIYTKCQKVFMEKHRDILGQAVLFNGRVFSTIQRPSDHHSSSKVNNDDITAGWYPF